jgi:hypothetical protein
MVKAEIEEALVRDQAFQGLLFKTLPEGPGIENWKLQIEKCKLSDMTRTLEKDLKWLEKLAFKRRERCGGLVRRFHALKETIELFAEAQWIWNVYDWLLVPLTLWPLDFEGVAKQTLSIVEGKAKMDKRFWLLLRLLKAPPALKTQEAIAQYEKDVEKGNYHRLLRQPAKFKEMEAALKGDPLVREFWEEIEKLFDVPKFRSRSGVIRRRLSQERNFREGWKFEWEDERSQFQAVFDAFCYAWSLYGMERDRPLLMKMSVNPTPYGTLIFVPNHWSFDAHRDVDWKAITRLHRAQGTVKQGPKLSQARMELSKEAVLARKLWDEAGKKGLEGQKRYDFVCERMGKDKRTDPSWLKRLLRRSE